MEISRNILNDCVKTYYKDARGFKDSGLESKKAIIKVKAPVSGIDGEHMETYAYLRKYDTKNYEDLVKYSSDLIVMNNEDVNKLMEPYVKGKETYQHFLLMLTSMLIRKHGK